MHGGWVAGAGSCWGGEEGAWLLSSQIAAALHGGAGRCPPAALLDADERDSAVLRDSVKLI